MQNKSLVNIDREVAKSLYGQLCGAIVNIEYYEESKETPDLDKLDHYLLIRKALRREQSNFCNFSDEEAYEKRDNLISPVLCAIRDTDDPIMQAQVINKYKNEFIELIEQTKVRL